MGANGAFKGACIDKHIILSCSLAMGVEVSNDFVSAFVHTAPLPGTEVFVLLGLDEASHISRHSHGYSVIKASPEKESVRLFKTYANSSSGSLIIFFVVYASVCGSNDVLYLLFENSLSVRCEIKVAKLFEKLGGIGWKQVRRRLIFKTRKSFNEVNLHTLLVQGKS